MTVVNISFAANRILCLTDTLLYVGSRPAGLCGPKCMVADLGTFASATRGLTRAADAVDAVLRPLASFDRAERVLTGASAEIRALTAGENLETYLMGWSDRRQALAVVQFQWLQHLADLTVRELPPGIHIQPGSAALARAIEASGIREADEARMVKVALAQHRANLEAFDRLLCIGGVMHLTTVTAAGCRQHIAGLYPDYEAMADQFVDPLGLEVGAYLNCQRQAA